MSTLPEPHEGHIPLTDELVMTSTPTPTVTENTHCPYSRFAKADEQRALAKFALNSARKDLSNALATITDMGGDVSLRAESFSKTAQIFLRPVSLGNPDERVAALEEKQAFQDVLETELSKSGSDSSGIVTQALSKALHCLKLQRRFEDACDEVEKRKEELRIAMEHSNSATSDDAT